MTAEELVAARAHLMQQFDQLWVTICATLADRDAQRAATVRTILAAPTASPLQQAGGGFDAARRAWPYLDHRARVAWHQGFTAIWRGVVSDRRQAEIIYGLFLPPSGSDAAPAIRVAS